MWARIARAVRGGYLLDWLRALLLLPRYSRQLAELQQTQADMQQAQADMQQVQADMQQAQADLQQAQANMLHAQSEHAQQLRALQPLLPPEHLPFAHIERAAPWLQRAEHQVGVAVTQLSPEQRQAAFYTYYSEMAGGVESILRQQYQVYWPLLPESELPIVDIGCGAGEFLAFAREQGRLAIGVEPCESEVNRARQRGLTVHCDYAGAFLVNTEQAFAAVTLFQVIEHLPRAEVVPTLQACIERLAPGGALLVETVNLRHPLAFNGFYTDPTHERPLADNYLTFLLQWLGLRDIRLVFTLPDPMPGSGRESLSQLYVNYAVLGYRLTDRDGEARRL